MPNVLAYTMSLDNKGFTGPLRSAEGMVGSSVGKIAAVFTGLGAGILAGAAGFVSLEKIVSSIVKVGESGRHLQMLHTATGQTVHDLVILQKAFDDVGIGAEAVPHALIMLQTALGGVNEQGQPTKKIFDQLGVSIGALKGQSAISQIQAIATAIAGLSSQEEKMAATRAIFGRSGGELMAILADPSQIQAAVKEWGELADVQQKNAAAFAKLYLAIQQVKEKIATIFVGLTQQIGPQITKLFESFKSSFDGLKIGERIGDAINAAIESVREGKLGEVLGLSIAAGVEKAAPMIQDALNGAFRTSLANLRASFEQAMDEFGHAGNALKNPFNLFRPSAVRMFKTPEDEAADLQQRTNKILAEPVQNTPGAHTALDALNKLFDELNAKIRERTGAPEEAVSGKSGTNTFSLSDLAQQAASGAKLTEGDRLAKIGGFIGGGANAMLDYARRTADNTAKIAALLSPSARTSTQQSEAAEYA